MALLCRAQQWKMIQFSRRYNNFHFRIPWPCFADHPSSSSHDRDGGINKLCRLTLMELFNGVRFFAAPAQSIKKEDDGKASKGPRMNEQVSEHFVRLVIDERHGIVPTHLALLHAKTLKLDLVEVARDAEHPVCKIIDFHMEKYKKQVKGKEKAKSGVTLRKGECKEVRFTSKTELKDLKMKANTVKRLMERGYRVKCVAMGKEGQDLKELLSRLSDLIEDVAVVECEPKVESKQAHLIVRHIKFSSSKKSGKKASMAVATSSVMQNAAPSSNASGYSETDSEDSGLESDCETIPDDESDELSASSPAQGKATWSAFVTSNNDTSEVIDLSEVFDLSDGVKMPSSSSSADQHMKVNSESTSSGAAPIFPDIFSTKIPDFVGSRVSSPSPEPENRYKQSTTRKGPGTTDPTRLASLPNSRIPHFGSYQGPIPGQGRQSQPQGSSISSLIRGSVTAAKQEPARLGDRSPPSSTGYGILRDETNKGNNPSASPGKHGSVPGTGKLNSSTPSSIGRERERSSGDGGGQWGIFSADISNPSTGKHGDSQAKFQR
ncbi:hypothetical protein Dimus_002809 [Dionaea muscipula]